MSREPTSYEVSDEELITRLIRASGQAGTSVSGLCIDIAAGYHVANMHFLKGVVLARLAGKKPPYEPGARVVVNDKRGVSEKSWRGPTLSYGCEYTVKKVWYSKDDWHLELKEIEGDSDFQIYRAVAFQPVNAESPATVVA